MHDDKYILGCQTSAVILARKNPRVGHITICVIQVIQQMQCAKPFAKKTEHTEPSFERLQEEHSSIDFLSKRYIELLSVQKFLCHLSVI